jgi:hypothetical protein
MKRDDRKQGAKSMNRGARAAGCLVMVLLFPICMYLFGSFAIMFAFTNPSSCPEPNQCSPLEQLRDIARGIVYVSIFFGGGVGIPIAIGILISKAIKAVDPRE